MFKISIIKHFAAVIPKKYVRTEFEDRFYTELFYN